MNTCVPKGPTLHLVAVFNGLLLICLDCINSKMLHYLAIVTRETEIDKQCVKHDEGYKSRNYEEPFAENIFKLILS